MGYFGYRRLLPSQYFTYRLENHHRAANVPYFSGPGLRRREETPARQAHLFLAGARIFATAKNRITARCLLNSDRYQ